QPGVVFFDALDRQPIQEIGVAHPGTQSVQVGKLGGDKTRRRYQSLLDHLRQGLDVGQGRLAAEEQRYTPYQPAADRQAEVIVYEHEALAIAEVLGKGAAAFG